MSAAQSTTSAHASTVAVVRGRGRVSRSLGAGGLGSASAGGGAAGARRRRRCRTSSSMADVTAGSPAVASNAAHDCAARIVTPGMIAPLRVGIDERRVLLLLRAGASKRRSPGRRCRACTTGALRPSRAGGVGVEEVHAPERRRSALGADRRAAGNRGLVGREVERAIEDRHRSRHAFACGERVVPLHDRRATAYPRWLTALLDRVDVVRLAS